MNQSFLCWLAQRASQAWDFIDERDIDKHAVSLFIMWGTWKLTEWAMHFAQHGDRPGLEVAAIIGAVAGPYLALQGFALKWYFEARSS